jgi:hypothetical protein
MDSVTPDLTPGLAYSPAPTIAVLPAILRSIGYRNPVPLDKQPPRC